MGSRGYHSANELSVAPDWPLDTPDTRKPSRCRDGPRHAVSIPCYRGRSMPITDYLQRFWGWFTFAVAVAILLGAGVLIFETLPPRMVVMATGAEGGANHELGLRYQEILAKAGVKLQLQTTAGGVENLARLRDPHSGVAVGFVQGGTTTKKESPGSNPWAQSLTSRFGSLSEATLATTFRPCADGEFQSDPREAEGERWPLIWPNGQKSTPLLPSSWTCRRSQLRKN